MGRPVDDCAGDLCLQIGFIYAERGCHRGPKSLTVPLGHCLSRQRVPMTQLCLLVSQPVEMCSGVGGSFVWRSKLIALPEALPVSALSAAHPPRPAPHLPSPPRLWCLLQAESLTWGKGEDGVLCRTLTACLPATIGVGDWEGRSHLKPWARVPARVTCTSARHGPCPSALTDMPGE